MGLLEVLTIIFVVLKLVGVIAWSWWLVLLPTIISVSIGILIFSVFAIVYVATTLKVKRDLRRMFDDK